MGGALGVLNQGLFANTGEYATSGLFITGNIKQFGRLYQIHYILCKTYGLLEYKKN